MNLFVALCDARSMCDAWFVSLFVSLCDAHSVCDAWFVSLFVGLCDTCSMRDVHACFMNLFVSLFDACSVQVHTSTCSISHTQLCVVDDMVRELETRVVSLICSFMLQACA